MSGKFGNSTTEMQLESSSVVCYSPSMITMRSNGMWQGEKPTDYSLPLFMIQLMIIVTTTRVLNVILRPLRQPRVIAEIVGGVILGPSVLGKVGNVARILFPLRSVTMLETMANVGLIFFLFQIGLEMDLSVIKRTGRKALVVAVSGMALPFVVGTFASFFLHHYTSEHIRKGTFLLFLGVALSVTAFPVLARILAELKLLSSDLGRLAISAAIIGDVFGWVMLAVAVSISENYTGPISALWVVIGGVLYVLFCLYVLRPAIMWVIRRTPEGEAIDEVYICFILLCVLLCSFVTDAIGMHSIFGAFTFGLVVPNGPLGIALVEKLEDFVTGLMLPIFFAISGLKTNLGSIGTATSWVLVLIILMASAGKIGGTAFIAVSYGMPIREGFSLAMLMNTKGLTEMIILNVAKDRKVLDEEAFAVMVLMAVLLTAIITPVVIFTLQQHQYQQGRCFTPYKSRMIQSISPDTELRLLACIHTPRYVPTIINFLQASNPSHQSPISLYALHLIELTHRAASAMVAVQEDQRLSTGSRPIDHNLANSTQIINAFKNYEQQQEGVIVHSLTAVSPYSSMHNDIYNLAEEKCVALIILPFHKQKTVDGGMEATNPAFRTLNQNVLAAAPCSVGILIDRGLGAARVAGPQVSHHIAVLFFGGPDDREALSYALRMAEHPAITLTVVRFLEGADAKSVDPPASDGNILTVLTDWEQEKQLDEDFIRDFRREVLTEDEKIVYTETVVSNAEETVAVISQMDSVIGFYLVGRGGGMTSPLTAGLTDWSECPELGPIGDLLASSDFAATVSVLVVQQYSGSPLASSPEQPERGRGE